MILLNNLEPSFFYEYLKAKLAQEDLNVKKIFAINDILRSQIESKSIAQLALPQIDTEFFNNIINSFKNKNFKWNQFPEDQLKDFTDYLVFSGY